MDSPPRDVTTRTLARNPRTYLDVFLRVRGLTRDWPRFYAARIRRQAVPVVLRLRNGLQFAVRPCTLDLDILDEVIRGGVYTRPGWALPTSANIVDVGAHIGAFSVLASRLWPTATVFAFEPQQDNFRLLLRNLRLNRCAEAQAHMQAVAGQSGRRDLQIAPTNTGGHSLGSGAGVTEQVDSVSLADFMEGHPVDRVHFLKMDCEGAEYEILESLSADHFSRIDRLAVEFHGTATFSPDEGATRLIERLRGMGYEYRKEVSPAARMLYAWRDPGR